MNEQRLRPTTALGTVLLTLGSLGFLLGALLLAAFVTAPPSAALDVNAISNAVLALASKVGMVATGVALLRRWRGARHVATGALAISTLSAIHDVATFQIIYVGERHSKAPWAFGGALAAYALAAGLYVYVQFYLRRAAVVDEFSSRSPRPAA